MPLVYKMTGWITYYWTTFYFQIKIKYTLFVGEIVMKYNDESGLKFYAIFGKRNIVVGNFEKIIPLICEGVLNPDFFYLQNIE